MTSLKVQIGCLKKHWLFDYRTGLSKHFDLQ